MTASLLAEVTVAEGWDDGFNLMMLAARLLIGATLAAHGLNKFFGGGRVPGTARWFDSMGMRPGKVHAVLAASTEVGAGTLMALGFLTPLAAAGYVGLMTVAGWTVHRPNGFFSAKDGWELNFVMGLFAVTIGTISPGRWSLDAQLGLDFAFDPRIGFLISAVFGLAAGAAQLIAFYRPPPPDDGNQS